MKDDLCKCNIAGVEERIKSYRKLLQETADEELRGLFRESLRDEQRYQKRVMKDHLTFCLGEHWRLLRDTHYAHL